MKSINFEQSNLKLTKPKDMTEEECGTLDVFKGLCILGEPGREANCVISCWGLDSSDLNMLLVTGKIWVFVYGENMPPIALTVKNPFKQETFQEAVENSGLSDEQKKMWLEKEIK